MATKFVPRHSVGGEVAAREDKSKLVSELLNPNKSASTSNKTIRSIAEYQQVPLEEITPRFVNKYRQSRIEQLANSIEHTNNRLIHPIVLVRAEDLPLDSEVRKEIESQGKNVSDFKYIIVSGERRYHAFCLLKEKYPKKIGSFSPFETITANVLTKAEAQKEQIFYQDANNQTRHITPAEAVWFVKDALKEVQTDKQKAEAMVNIYGDIFKDERVAARKFKSGEYCKILLEREMGISDWAEKTFNNMCVVALNCEDEIIDALLLGEYNLNEAKKITRFKREDQLALLNLFKTDIQAYKDKLLELKTDDSKTITKAGTRKEFRNMLKALKTYQKTLKQHAKYYGSNNNDNELLIVKKIEDFMAELETVIKTTK